MCKFKTYMHMPYLITDLLYLTVLKPFKQKWLGVKDRQGILSCRRLVPFYYTNNLYSYVSVMEVKVITRYIVKKSFAAHCTV